jgi:uncharacterized protein YndB with AHSA1/START domain
MASRFLYVTYIRTTPEKLWAALTKPEFTKAYWCETWQESDWQTGSSWRLMIPDGRLGDFGTIVEHDPPRRLVLTWQNDFIPAMKAEGPSRMTYELEPIGDVVKLTLLHESDIDGSKLIEGVSNGWPSLLASLKSLLETGEPLDITRKWPGGM